MLSTWVITSAIVLLIVNAGACARKGSGIAWASVCSFAAALLLYFSPMMPVVALSALFVGHVGVVCYALKARRRWFVASSLGVTVAVYLLIPLPELLAWHGLKSEYPMESLVERLAYEERPRTASVGAPFQSVIRSDRLADLEMLFQLKAAYCRHRVRSLERLHSGVVKQFIESPGFGVGRDFGWPQPSMLEEELENRREDSDHDEVIQQPKQVYSLLEAITATARAATVPTLLSAHDENTLDFLNPRGFGYVRNLEQVAGFLPHQFHERLHHPDCWQVERLELVGLLKYDEPVVYLSPNLPRMDELSAAPTRSLDAFEKKALEELLGGEDLMVQKNGQRMRMLGSIRAVDRCVRCHRARRGELLGAFSYQMVSEGQCLNP